MRLYAWAGFFPDRVSRKGKPRTEAREYYDCSRLCGDGLGKYDEESQRERRCALPTFKGKWPEQDGTQWAPVFMGRAPLPQLSDGDKYEALLETCPSGDWEAPCEDPADGCPGAWYRSEFVASFRRYRRNEHGNPLINADTPGHILEALFYFEHHHSLAQMHFHEAIKA